MSGRQVGVRFTDNQSGSGSTVQVPVESKDQNVSALVVNQTVAKDGYLTSVELVSNFQNTTLIVKSNGKEIGKASGNGNNQVTFARTPIGQLTINLSAS